MIGKYRIYIKITIFTNHAYKSRIIRFKKWIRLSVIILSDSLAEIPVFDILKGLVHCTIKMSVYKHAKGKLKCIMFHNVHLYSQTPYI